MTDKEPKNGGEPTLFARCTDCGEIYPAQEAENEDYRPVGTDGSCKCGNEEFELAV